ncbi:MAG: GNAT family N-acetyltransferase [Dehalococcoidia bacterium]
MEQLSPSEFERLRPLVPHPHAAGHMAFVHSVIDGTMPGTAFADRADNPRSAIVCNEGGFWHAVGEPDAAFARDVAGELPALVRYPGTAVWASTPGWDAALGEVFALRRERLEYTTPEQFAPRRALPRGYRIAPIDAAIAGKFDGAVDPWVVKIWGGPERFAERAFGFAVMDGERLTSFCCPCAIGGPVGLVEAEVEVGTNDAYRRMGLARAASIDYFEECQRRGLRPSWTCGADNIASHHLAISLGFRLARSVAGYAIESEMERDGDGKWRIAATGGE